MLKLILPIKPSMNFRKFYKVILITTQILQPNSVSPIFSCTWFTLEINFWGYTSWDVCFNHWNRNYSLSFHFNFNLRKFAVLDSTKDAKVIGKTDHEKEKLLELQACRNEIRMQACRNEKNLSEGGRVKLRNIVGHHGWPTKKNLISWLRKIVSWNCLQWLEILPTFVGLVISTF